MERRDWSRKRKTYEFLSSIKLQWRRINVKAFKITGNSVNFIKTLIFQTMTSSRDTCKMLIIHIHWNMCQWTPYFTNWSNSQFPECTGSYNAPFRTEICTFLVWIRHCGIWTSRIQGFVKLVYSAQRILCYKAFSPKNMLLKKCWWRRSLMFIAIV